MKKVFICAVLLVFALAFVGDGFCADQASAFNALKIKRAKNDDYKGTDTLRIENSSGASMWRLDMSGNLSVIDSSGNTDYYVPRNKVVYITKASQLSSWWTAASATAGQSYFQCEPGTTYLVDPHAIYLSGVTDGNGVSAFKQIDWSGVTAILPNADKYSGPAYNVRIGIVTTGTTGSASAKTGATAVYVFPYGGVGTGNGVSAYGKKPTFYETSARSGNTPQNLLTEYAATSDANGSGVSVIQLVGNTGASYWGLRSAGTVSFGMEKAPSGVSAWIVERKGSVWTFGY